MLWHVLARVRRARKLDDIVVATSTARADDAIDAFCRAHRFAVFRGSEADVLDRYYRAALEHRADDIVRITADCPLIDPEIIDRVVEEFFLADCDYAANILRRTYPHGLDTEICKFSVLASAWRAATLPPEREHVTPYLRDSSRFKLHSVERAEHLPQGYYRWTVDELCDLEFVRAIYAHLGTARPFSWRAVVELLNAHPELRDINAGVVQAAGFIPAQPLSADV